MTPEDLERADEYADWCSERYAFLCNSDPDDLPEPFACGWCAIIVGTNGVQSKEGGVHLVGRIHVDTNGTPWHYLCILEKETRRI